MQKAKWKTSKKDRHALYNIIALVQWAFKYCIMGPTDSYFNHPVETELSWLVISCLPFHKMWIFDFMVLPW